MNEPVILRNSFAMGLVAMLQIIAPALIAVSCLYAVFAAYGEPVQQYVHSMSLVVGLLALLFSRPSRMLQPQLLPGSFPIALGVVARWVALLAVLLAIGYLTRFSSYYARRVVLTWAAITPGFILIATLVLSEVMRRLLRDPKNSRKTVVAGYTDLSLSLTRRLMRSSDFCMTVEGFFDDRGPDRLKINGDLRLLGKLSDLPAYVREHGVGVIFIALPIRHVRRVMDLVQELRDTTASIYYVPDIFVFDLIQARSGAIDGIPVISMCETPLWGYRAATKRLTDIAISVLVLLLVAPLMVVLAIAVKCSSPGPAIFRQRRYGLNGEEITVYKFRSMRVQGDDAKVVQATKDDPRTTKIGRFLRRYSLDELPQLINVLEGSMSLVGPRPHAVEHNEMYRKLIKGYMMRHKMLPGVTGLAQVNGMRGETRTLDQMEARIRYDLEYLRNWSVRLDLEILAKTVLRVLRDSQAF
ncbi:MAG TPA: undecaprenyl-phosphate glucose phosphotransferase [Steroidobacteraceae bacterium]